MEHEIYLNLVEHNNRITELEKKVEGMLKATGLKPKNESK